MTWTRDQYNAAWRKWYSKNAARKKAWGKRRSDELRQWFRALKATKRCEQCGETAPECLHFHHRDPNEKEFVLANHSTRYSRERILAEIAKCIVLCANCHAKHHWDERTLSSG